jgi:hypothetical protein
MLLFLSCALEIRVCRKGDNVGESNLSHLQTQGYSLKRTLSPRDDPAEVPVEIPVGFPRFRSRSPRDFHDSCCFEPGRALGTFSRHYPISLATCLLTDFSI